MERCSLLTKLGLVAAVVAAMLLALNAAVGPTIATNALLAVLSALTLLLGLVLAAVGLARSRRRGLAAIALLANALGIALWCVIAFTTDAFGSGYGP